jgi:hypothetical protein
MSASVKLEISENFHVRAFFSNSSSLEAKRSSAFLAKFVISCFDLFLEHLGHWNSEEKIKM